ncbi:hypothetical protein NOF04DRAFT_9486 [Fusarium oxysporum II5]|uniref:Uncharacterized protein n=2 Tax=Fusarium oxysporum species complex TaxID=171631 RepID=X0J0M3_FUSO5|nr:uncharacterized protein FOIG_16821 [Fusarium odoratissimum NRRL 54006]EXL89896.1 hypothetical protein FOIG_16821 [Fusarium odoratissimum NRRL 54006]KAK2122329.1 hypothetical protein NOF04DRAFT_9486 [Fusarium oxysporum II5]TXB97969.1 hypothetical protein FocTR4_00016938 [Fusarium oxysporum f. sp. cubense]
MRRKVKQMMRLLHKTPHDARQPSCPEFRASAVVSPLNNLMEPREELEYSQPGSIHPAHVSYPAGNLADPSLTPAPLSISKSRYGIYLSSRLMERY